VTGTIEPDFSARVLSEVAGVLEQFSLPDGTPVEEGVRVERGTVIAVVEHEDLGAAVEEARANLRVAQSAVGAAKVALAGAEREKRRMAALFKDGTATERQRDEALTACESAEAGLKLAADRVEQARAVLERTRLRYQDATVEAPISGIVSRCYVDRGGYVGPSTPLVSIVNIDSVEVQGGVAGRYFSMLRPGRTRVRVCVDAYPDEGFVGLVERVRPELDPATRTARITVRVPNPEHRLKPGMFARLEVVIARREGVPIVPDAALIRSDGGHEVFIVKDGTARSRKVRIGLEEGDRNEAVEGVEPGDLVVVRGQHILSDGMEVRTELEGGRE